MERTIQLILLLKIFATLLRNVRCGDQPVIAPFYFPPVLKEGERANTICSVRSGDRPIEFAWKKDGQPLPVASTTSVQSIEDSSVLIIKSVDSSSSGNYTCIVTNSFGKDQYTATLVVTSPPTWLKEPTDTIVKEGESVLLECAASGVPSPHVKWKTDVKGTKITSDSSSTVYVSSTGGLVIGKVTYSMEGSYTCEAENGFGLPLTKSISLTVRGTLEINKINHTFPYESIKCYDFNSLYFYNNEKYFYNNVS
ncbi:cell adhesion molecule Dscam2-like [Parasteatoda tepidariorum]|uniref:cell adhesion molecule Dscam2-like n=1 Tax=Parasteatoda tepidariorum TaxID=114398 RepID=UPI0039BCB02C